MNQASFFKNFLGDHRIGAITRTSKVGVQRVASRIDFSKDITIVEYGPGDGVFTKEAIARMTPGSRLIAVETNVPFIRELRTAVPDPRLTVIEGDALNIKNIMIAAGIPHADYVVSSIPCTFFSEENRNKLVESTKSVLGPQGAFVVYQYSPLMQIYLKKSFPHVQTSFMPLNIPPMFIMKGVVS